MPEWSLEHKMGESSCLASIEEDLILTEFVVNYKRVLYSVSVTSSAQVAPYPITYNWGWLLGIGNF